MLTYLKLTKKEKDTGTLSTSHLAKAKTALDKDGIVVVEGLIEPADLSYLNEQFQKDWAEFKSQGKNHLIGGDLLGHYNSVPPTMPDCIFPSILSNKILYQITRAYFSHPTVHVHYGCNVNLPGSTRQSFHSDDPAASTEYLVINIPLVETSEKNGSTEVVPGTQGVPFNHRALFNTLQTIRPERVNTQLGSVFLRHPSLWHRGMPNQSASLRPMVGFKHYAKNAKDFPASQTLSLPKNAEKILKVGKSGKIHAVFSGKGERTQFLEHKYFGRGLKGVAKELCFYTSPDACEWIKRTFQK